MMKRHKPLCASGLTRKGRKNWDWIDKVWFSDEAHLHLDDYMNSKNNTIWKTALPQEVLQQPSEVLPVHGVPRTQKPQLGCTSLTL